MVCNMHISAYTELNTCNTVFFTCTVWNEVYDPEKNFDCIALHGNPLTHCMWDAGY